MSPPTRASRLVLSMSFVVGCGARDALLDDERAASGDNGSTGAFAVVDCDPGGVRLCGGDFGCPPLDFEACPGVGCTPVADRDTGAPLDLGICWPDLENWVGRPCLSCDADEACARYADDLRYYCVPLEVCGALLAMGGGAGCRYTDGSAFTGEAISLDPSTCDKNSGVQCGPACADCDGPQDEVCMGLSPTSPVGVCIFDNSPYACERGGPPCGGSSQTCMVFNVPAADQAFADGHGICEVDWVCEGAAKSGAVTCYSNE